MNKERVIELAREAGLIEAEVRGDAEPVEYQYRMRPLWGRQNWPGWSTCKKDSYDNYKRVPVLHDWEYEVRALYTHPAPAVVAQLVDALAGLIDFIEIDNLKIDQDALRIARAALAAAKENGL